MSSNSASIERDLNPLAGVNFGDLEKSLLRPRTLINGLLSCLVSLVTVVALIPLFSVLWMLVWRGGHRLSTHLFTQLPPAPLEQGGGFGNAVVGSIIIVALATLISVPIGILSAIFLAGTDSNNRLAQIVRFGAKVLTGFPSILAGVVAYGAIVLKTGGFSAVAGAIAISLLMLPTILLTAEDSIRMVPDRMKEAAIGMGATSTQVTWMVSLPTALPGILTGIMLAIARGAGETAPLLFTALFSNYWPTQNGHPNLMQPTASLAVLIYNFAGMPFRNQLELAWSAALVLVLLVLLINMTGQILSRRRVQ